PRVRSRGRAGRTCGRPRGRSRGPPAGAGGGRAHVRRASLHPADRELRDRGRGGVVSEARPRVAVVVFPGSNDDRDAALALEQLGADPVLHWHADRELPDVGAVVLPGGFSYGDYLRAGAIARFSPAMQAVADFAAEGGSVLGICNGFQVLCEAGLLPGALRPNESLSFVCEDVPLRVEHAGAFLTRCEA